MINNDKIFATEVGVYACSQSLFDENAPTIVGDFQLGDCNDGHEDPELESVEEDQSEEGIGGFIAKTAIKAGGGILGGIFKGCGWLVSTIAGCPAIMAVIFVVLAVSGTIAFAIHKSNEAEGDDIENKKNHVMGKIKAIANNNNTVAAYKELLHDNFSAYNAAIVSAEEKKSEIEHDLANYKASGVKVKYWKENKFENQIKTGIIKMAKHDKGSKNLKDFPLVNTGYAQVTISKPNPKNPKFCQYLQNLAKKLSTKALTFKVNKDNTGLVSDAFHLNINDKFINAVKQSK